MLLLAMLAQFQQLFYYYLFKWCLPYRRSLALKRLAEFQ